MKYKELMNAIKVTPEMRARILDGMKERRAAQMRRKRLRRIYAGAASLAACLVLALMIGKFAGRAPEPTNEPLAMNPYGATECASIDELSRTLGFAVKTPSVLPFAPEQTTYSAMFETFAQIDYSAGGASICARMAPGAEDISGDYNEYAQEETAEIGDWNVLLKGDGSAVSLATWTDGAYAYSISADPAISRADMLRAVESMR